MPLLDDEMAQEVERKERDRTDVNEIFSSQNFMSPPRRGCSTRSCASNFISLHLDQQLQAPFHVATAAAAANALSLVWLKSFKTKPNTFS